MKFFKNSSYYLFLSFLKVLLSLIINILLGRLANGPSQFGLILFVLSLIDLFIVIFGFGIHGSVVRYSKNNYNEGKLKEYLEEITSYIYSIYFLFFIFCLLFPSFVSKLFFETNDLKLVFLLAFLFPIRGINRTFSSIYWGFNNFLKRGFNELLPIFIQFCLLIFIYLFFRYNPHTIKFIILIYIFSEFITIIYFNLEFKNNYNISLLRYKIPNFKFSSTFKKNFNFGIWSMTAAISLIIMNIIDKITINKFLSSSDLGKYTLLVFIGSHLLLPVRVISNVTLTHYLEQWNHDRSAVINKINNIFMIILFYIISFGFFINAVLSFFIKKIYGTSFLGFENLFPLLLISIILKTCYMVTGTLSAISEKPYITTISFIPGLILNIIGNIVFVPIYGVKAAIITTIVSYLFIVVFLYVLYYKEHIYLGYKTLVVSICISLFIYLSYYTIG